MRRLLLRAPHDLVVEEVPDPLPAPGEVLVRVAAAGVCGSDLYGSRGVNDRRRPGTVMGHEVSGTVVGLGDDVETAWLGRAVAVNPVLGCEHCRACRAGERQRCPDKALIGCVPQHPGGFAELLTAPVTALAAWPGPAPLVWGALAEPLAVGLHAVGRLALRDTTVLVVGSGPVALSAGWAGQRGGAQVVVTETEPGRGRLVRSLGLATQRQDQLHPATRYDAVVDCVANEESLHLALRHVRPTGSVVVVGLGATVAPIPVDLLVQGDRALLGSAQYSSASFADAVAWLASGRLDVSPLMGEPQPLTAGPVLFRTWREGDTRPLRSLLAPA